MAIKGIICACKAGACAALASVCGKLAASSESANGVAAYGATGGAQIVGITQEEIVFYLSLTIRCLAISGIFLFNAMMWVLFTKSMHLCSSTVEATAFNTASNFIFTAIFGLLLFGDSVNLQWCFGTSLMVMGLVIMHRSSRDDQARLEDPPPLSKEKEESRWEKETKGHHKEKSS